MLKRKLVSISIALSFIVVLVTSVFMYFRPYQSSTASLHTAFGMIFIIAGVFHIVNNFLPLKRYASDEKSKLPVSKSLLSLLAIMIVLSYLFYTGQLGFGGLYDWGNEYRNAQKGKTLESKNISYITLSETVGDYTIDIEGKLGDAFAYPMFAAWVEDEKGNYLQTIYVSESIGTSIYDYKKGEKGRHIIRRPSGLPVWAHRRNIPAKDGLMIPLGEQPDLDGYTGATPLEDFNIQTNFNVEKDSIINIFFEVNQSYDWNEYYTKDKFPQDSIYTISGQSGQPSLVYKSTINLADLASQPSYIMTAVGHGHHSGKNGTLYTDLKNMTTAHEIVSRTILTLSKL